MSYNEGVNPSIIGEDDLDINNAKAGTDLFHNTETKEFEIDSSTLFTGEYQPQTIAQDKEDLKLFENQIEFENDSTTIVNNNDALSISYIAVVLSIVMISTYIYYIIQKLRINKEIISVSEDIKSI